jgi:hypothetical protein
MTNYGIEQLAKQRIDERLHEADRERMARTASTRPDGGRPWRERLTVALVRRLNRVAEAS